MLQVLGKIVGSILRSLFISIVMFVIVFSVITGEFPPNFKRVTNTFKNLQQMTQLSRQIQEQQKALKDRYAAHGEVDDSDVEALQELNLKRAELGAGLLQAENPASDNQETNELKQKVKELETQLFRLQQRVSQLESKSK